MKEVTVKIICDGCSKDISPHVTGYEAKYILTISTMDIAQHTQDMAIYAMRCYPPIDKDLYFCNFECIKNYIEK